MQPPCCVRSIRSHVLSELRLMMKPTSPVYRYIGIHYIASIASWVEMKLRIEVEQRLSRPHRDPLRHKKLTLDVLKQFRLIYGSVRHHFRQIEETCGVSGSQLWMLHELQKAPGMGVTEVAHGL